MTSRRNSVIIGEIQSKSNKELEMTEEDTQIFSMININNKEKNSIENDEEKPPKETEKLDPEFESFFNEFIMKSNSILSLFCDRVFTINQSVMKQEWRLYCIYKCMEIFNNNRYYRYIQNFYKNSLAIETGKMMVFAYFAPLIKSHNPSLFSQIFNEIKKKHQAKKLNYSFNEFYECFEYNNETNWKNHGSYLENCEFRADSPLYAIKHDDITFLIKNKE